MLTRIAHRRVWCLGLAVVLAAVAGCPEKETATEEPAATVEVEKPAPTEAETEVEKPAPTEPPAKTPIQAPTEAKTAAATEAEVQAKLAKADLVDGTADKIVSKCPACALKMDGKPEHALQVAGYTLYFCCADCKQGYEKDPTKAILALKIPED